MNLTKLRNQTREIYPFLYAALCLAIPFAQFGEAIPNIAAIPVLAAFFLLVDRKLIREKIDLKFALFLILSVLIFIEALVFNRQDDFKYAERLIIIPILVLFSFPLNKRKPVLLAFLIGATILMMTSYFRILGFVFNSGKFDFSVGEFINQILLGDRPYVGFVYVVGILLSIYFMRIGTMKKHKALWLCIALLFFLLILIISARMSLLSLVLIAFSSFFFVKNWKIPALISTGLIFVIFLLIKLNPNFVDRFYAGFKQENYTLEKMLIMEPRYHIWGCSNKIANEKAVFLKGIGIENTAAELVECFKQHELFKNEEHRQYFINSRFNTHNQFLNFYLGTGIFTTVLFAMFFLLWIRENRRNYVVFSLILALLMFCWVENVLSRQMGCLLFGFVWVASILISKRENRIPH